MKPLLPTAAAVLALLGAAPAAQAATPIGEYLTFSGFGTVGAVRTNTDEGSFGRDRQTGGAKRQADIEVDSNLGLQVTAKATDWLSGTVQVLASKRDQPHTTARAEWAFLTLKPVDGLTLRGGRMATPVFLISESRNVGYANTWVRAPNEVYALNGFPVFDGLDATYQRSLGPVGLTVSAMAGKSRWYSGPLNWASKNLRGVNLQLDTDWGSVHYGQMSTDLMLEWLPKPDGYKFTDLGFTIDHNNVVMQAELVKRQSNQMPDALNASGWYVMAGYRWGSFTPYAITSRTKNEIPQAFWHAAGDQKTTAFGVRWDAFRSAAIKLQVDRINTLGSNGISFTTPLVPLNFPGAPPLALPVTRPVTALSLALDFTF